VHTVQHIVNSMLVLHAQNIQNRILPYLGEKKNVTKEVCLNSQHSKKYLDDLLLLVRY